jgi:hypothetical protein
MKNVGSTFWLKNVTTFFKSGLVGKNKKAYI